ncbi:uroporphyrinogen-III C-methyltransferase [bacterium]|nr:uroporphyrinogen-III C-methyltransferase [bacterium]|tara:strand:- start:131 stop:1210 length:1080 start_codon:yes stop_codon:yes gene_type:complete
MSEEIESKGLKIENDFESVIAKNNGNRKFLISVSFFIIVFTVYYYYGYQKFKILEAKLMTTITLERNILHDIDEKIKQSKLTFHEFRNTLNELETSHKILTEVVNQPLEQKMDINEDYALVEVEHLLIIARYNIQLGNDMETALSAMEAASARLNGLLDPMSSSVRDQLTADMNKLRSLRQPDLGGLGLSLSDLISRVDQLPLKEYAAVEKLEISSEQNEDKSKGIKNFFTLVLNEVKSLVVITRDSDLSQTRLLPDQIYFLRSNLKIELANARFAVFNRDTNNFHISIRRVEVWLNEYFDLSDASSKNIYDSLMEMKNLELEILRIDISSSLESVRALMRSQGEVSSRTTDDRLDTIQ